MSETIHERYVKVFDTFEELKGKLCVDGVIKRSRVFIGEPIVYIFECLERPFKDEEEVYVIRLYFPIFEEGKKEPVKWYRQNICRHLSLFPSLPIDEVEYLVNKEAEDLVRRLSDLYKTNPESFFEQDENGRWNFHTEY